MTSEIPTFLIGQHSLGAWKPSVWKKALDRTGTRFCGREQSLGDIMANCPLQPKLEERSPQPSTSGYCLLEVIDDEVPGPSVPWVDLGTPSKFLYWNRKSEWSDESEEEPEEKIQKQRAPEPEEIWVVDTLCGLKMKITRRRVSPVLPLNTLLGDKLQMHYKVASFLYSSPWVDSSPPNFLCGQRKREWSDESEEEPEEETEKQHAPKPEETWVVDTLYGLKMNLTRRRVSPVLPQHYKALNTLLGPSSPWLLCRKRRREWSDESEEEPEETWVLETLHGLKMKLKRRRLSPVLPEHHEAFNRLLEDPVVKRFLAWDKDLRASDKYLLAMVIAYFSRAGLFSWQYQRIHFFLALYLANDMEEDNQGPKQAIFYFLYGKNRSQRVLFQKLRFQFFCSMRCRAWVSPEELHEVGGVWGPRGGGEESGGWSQDEGMEGYPGGIPFFSRGICFCRSRLMTRGTGCGHEIVPSFPRAPGTVQA
ncbi:Speedy protein E3 [Plecturocebus cupreus]